jgi:hypothetical protein
MHIPPPETHPQPVLVKFQPSGNLFFGLPETSLVPETFRISEIHSDPGNFSLPETIEWIRPHFRHPALIPLTRQP